MKNKIKKTIVIFGSILLVAMIYGSYIFYDYSVKTTTKPTIDTLNIDSIKSDYQSQIQKLEDKISNKDIIINQKTSEIFSLRKNYDSVNNKLWYYKSRLKADTLK